MDALISIFSYVVVTLGLSALIGEDTNNVEEVNIWINFIVLFVTLIAIITLGIADKL